MEDQYWIKREDKITGPFSGQQLAQMAAAGMIVASDLISRDQVNSTAHEELPEVLEQGESPTDDPGAIPVTQVMDFLHANKAFVNTTDEHGRTPLHIAVGAGNLELVRFLITLGANVEAKDMIGDTPLHRAHCPEVVSTILAGAPPTTRLLWKTNESGETSLHLFASKGNLEAVKAVFGYFQTDALRRIQEEIDDGFIEPLEITQDALVDRLINDPSYHRYYRFRFDLFINTQDNNGRTPLERTRAGLIDRILQTTNPTDVEAKQQIADILRAHGAKRSPLWYRGPLTPKIMTGVVAAVAAIGIVIWEGLLFTSFGIVFVVIFALVIFALFGGFKK